jgi:hypothetical protein
MSDCFFTKTRCDRCHKPLDNGRTMSWFNEQTICLNCSTSEDQIKQNMITQNIDPVQFEGCGEIPRQFL